MYRDNTLIPAEAVRLAALGSLVEGEKSYADLAREIRFFVARIVGPSLDLLGSSLELLRLEGLTAAKDGTAATDSLPDDSATDVGGHPRADQPDDSCRRDPADHLLDLPDDRPGAAAPAQ